MTEWWLASLSGAISHEIAPWAYWHARCMVLAWAVLLPLGALLARFYKVRPRQDWPRELDDKHWWHGHRSLQWGGVGVMLVGLWLAWSQGGAGGAVAEGTMVDSRGTAAVVHAWAGWAVCVAACLQIAGAMARGSKGGPTDARLRGDHYDMTRWRRGFERIHKSLGWLSVVAAVGVTGLGLVVADAPRWMAAALVLWWALLVAAFVVLQTRGRCIDTYQAIWGPDRNHPGNRVAPTGWGVRRPLG
ncbi:MAG: cytochrome B561 [Methylibium sp. NZG]|nr:MAG: cytochrome B561 [Methylibium sp. NZG]